MTAIEIQVFIHCQGQGFSTRFASLVTASADEPILSIVRAALARQNLPPEVEVWVIRCDGRVLRLEQTLAEAIPDLAGRGEIVLEMLPLPVPAARKPEAAARESEEDADFDEDFDSEGELLPGAEAEEESREPAARRRKATRAAGAAAQPGKERVQRHATVRYYNRMNPGRMYPLLVAVTARALEQVEKQAFGQRSRGFKARTDRPLVVEPVLPGCNCYPPRQRARVDRDEVKLTFYVVPQVVGEVHSARVVLRQNGEVLTEVPLDVRVSNRLTVAFLGIATLLLPFVSALLRHFKIDFESQLEDGFGVYTRFLRLVLNALSPEVLAALLFGLTVAAYLCLRPRRRDVFWDLTPAGRGKRPGPGFVRRVGRGLREAPGVAAGGVVLGVVLGIAVLLALLAAGRREQAVLLAPSLMGLLVVVGAAGGALGGLIDGMLGHGPEQISPPAR